MVIDGNEYITVEQAAERRKVPVGTVKSAISRNKLPSTFEPSLKRRLLKPSDVDAWVIGRGGARPGAGRKSATQQD